MSGLNNNTAARAKEQNALSVNPEEGSDLNDLLSLFPNPAQAGPLTIGAAAGNGFTWAGNVRIDIASAAGKVVYSEVITCGERCNEVSFDVSDKLAPGVYIVNTVINKKRFTKKLVIQKN